MPGCSIPLSLIRDLRNGVVLTFPRKVGRVAWLVYIGRDKLQQMKSLYIIYKKVLKGYHYISCVYIQEVFNILT